LEQGRFGGIFIADVLGTYDVYGGNDIAALRQGAQIPVADPLLLVSAMAAVTEHLGFGITTGTGFEHPYPFARRLSTLDHLTKGRIGWNVVTGYLSSAARNFGADDQLDHDERYNRADEYLEVLYKLWEGSWEDDAVVRDAAQGIYVDPAKVHHIGHQGAHYAVPGIHLSEPSPQRSPVIFQCGASPRGVRFAAENAEAIFVADLPNWFSRKLFRASATRWMPPAETDTPPASTRWLPSSPSEARTQYVPGTLRNALFERGDRLPEEHRGARYRLGGPKLHRIARLGIAPGSFGRDTGAIGVIESTEMAVWALADSRHSSPCVDRACGTGVLAEGNCGEEDVRDGFEAVAVDFVEALQFGAVEVEDADQFAVVDQWHDDFRASVTVTCDVAWEDVDVGDQLGFSGVGGGTADALAHGDSDAGRFALEWADDELPAVVEIEADPVQVGQCVEDQGREVGGVGDSVGLAGDQCFGLGDELAVLLGPVTGEVGNSERHG
jgi:alkanesulfonate monooxygenase SsuD/methylene tetrahydromethanopterin reductase-like flavin-dependent oxidoreductase (luciferase family)